MAEPRTLWEDLEAPEFLAELVAGIPDIAAIKLFRSASFAPTQNDFNNEEKRLIKEALSIGENLRLPFWYAILLLMSQLSQRQAFVYHEILARAGRHNGQDEASAFCMRREFCTASELRRLADEVPGGETLIVSSQIVSTKGDVRHLPMLDFHCEASAPNDLLVGVVIRELGLHGFLARSGRSYHFYADSLVDTEGLIAILGRALLFSPIIDPGWIAHQLIENACGLRISRGKNYSVCPTVFSIV